MIQRIRFSRQTLDEAVQRGTIWPSRQRVTRPVFSRIPALGDFSYLCTAAYVPNGRRTRNVWEYDSTYLVEPLVDRHGTPWFLAGDYNTSPPRGRNLLRKEHRNGYHNH